MATKQMRYDHPAYLAVHAASLGTITAGSGGVSQRWVAPFAVTLKSLQFTTITVGTGAATDAKTLFVVRRGTATTTIALFTTTAAIYSTNYTALLTGTNAALAQGDVAYVQKGTDATELGAAGLEYVIQPNADVTL
jgi:hypothetical protein